MVKKLVWYFYRKALIMEVISYIFIAAIVILTIATLFFPIEENFTINMGSFAYFGFIGFGGQMMIQDKYFIHTLPVERNDYLKAAKISSTITSSKTFLFLLCSIIMYGRVFTHLLNGYGWYLSLILWMLMFVTICLITYYMIVLKTLTFIPTDKENRKMIYSNTRLVLNILLIVAIAVVLIIGLSMMGQLGDREIITRSEVFKYYYIALTSITVGSLFSILGIYEAKSRTKRTLNYFEVI